MTARILTLSLLACGAAHAAGQFGGQDIGPVAGPLSAVTASVQGNSGRATSSFPFALPPARGRYQPSLLLTYSSGSGAGYAGVGWGISVSSIAPRLNATLGPDGKPRNEFILTLNGVTSMLVPDGTPSGYRPEIGEGYLRAVHDAASRVWSVTDSVGNSYRFEGQADRTAWLTVVIDVDGNWTKYEYDYDFGNYLLKSISYNFFDPYSPTDTRSPSTYFLGTFGTVIALQYGPWAASDVNLNPGGLLGERSKVLSAVLIERQDVRQSQPSLSTLFSYGLSYSMSSATARPLLSAIARIGSDNVPVETTRFGYTPSPPLGWEAAARNVPGPTSPAPTKAQCQQWFSHANGPVFDYHGNQVDVSNGYNTNIQQCSIRDVATWLDLDGDGLADLVWGDGDGLYWARNRSGPRSALQLADVAFIPSSAGGLWSDNRIAGQSPSGRLNAVQTTGFNYAPDSAQSKAIFNASGTAVVDVDGDGRPDLVGTSSACGPNAFSVKLNRGSSGGALSFADSICVAAPAAAMSDWTGVTGLRFLQAAYYTPATPASPPFVTPGVFAAGLLDLTGDGVADLVILTGPASARRWHVYPGYQNATGWTFSATYLPDYAAYAPGYNNDAISSGEHFLADVNGDGLPDRISKTSIGTVVEFNNGYTFLQAPAGSSGRGWLSAFKGAIKYPNSAGPYVGLGLGDSLVDLDRDGRPDFVVGASAGGVCPNDTVTSQFLLYQSRGVDLATTAVSLPALGPPWAPCTAPFQKYDATTAVVFHTESDYKNAPPPTGFNANLVDLDGDGAVDYVAADADLATWTWYRSAGFEAPPADLLSLVVSAAGMTTEVTYLPSSDFGTAPGAATYAVVRDVTTFGAGMPSQTTRHWYASPQVGTRWDEPSRPEPLGFAQSWEQDDTTLLVRQINWGTSHATKDFALGEIVGPSAGGFISTTAPPTVTPFIAVTHAPQLKSLLNGSCGANPGAGDYPLIRFDSKRVVSRADSGLSSSVTVDCAAVDSFGNVSKFYVDQDSGGTGDEYFGYAKFATSSLCPSCETEVWADTGAGSVELYHHVFHYDAPVGAFDNPSGTVTSGHLNFVEERVSQEGPFEIAEKRSFNGNGTLAAVRKDYPLSAVICSVTYEPMQVQVSSVSTSDGPTALTQDIAFNPATGLPVSRAGPYLAGQAASARTEYFLFDAATRLVAIGRLPPSGTTIGGAIAVFGYEQPGRNPRTHTPYPRSVTTFSFAGWRSVDINNIPATDDVGQIVDYYDGRDRLIQRRRRLAVGASSQALTVTNILGKLDPTQWLVENAILQDGAGRMVARFDPYYDSRGGLWLEPGWSTGKTRTVVSTAYDRFGRPSCQTRHPIAAGYAGPPPDCSSNFEDNANYRRAAQISYGTASAVAGGRQYLTVDLTPDWSNGIGGGFNKLRHYLDGNGRIAAIRDPDGNLSQVSRDVLGRSVAVTRGTVTVSHRTYDLRGRIIDEADASAGRRHFTYLSTGEISTVVQQPIGAGAAPSTGVEYSYGSLGRVSKVAPFKLTPAGEGTSCSLWQKQYDAGETATYAYDAGYNSAQDYRNTMGQLSSVRNGSSVTAYSYDGDGRIEREDRWIGGLPGVTRVSTDWRADGLPLKVTLGSELANLSLSYSYWYDSAGRLARVDDGAATTFWDVSAQLSGTGAYDALGRSANVQLDSGAIALNRTWSVNSALPLTVQTVLPGPKPLYALDGFAFLGGKLKEVHEQVANTFYGFGYDRAGRLTSAEAIPYSTLPTAQRYREQYTFVNDGSASFGNLQSVNRGLATQTSSFNSSSPDILQQITGSGTLSDFLSYDAHGRGLVASQSTAAGAVPALHRFSYDTLGRLASISRFGAKIEDLSYGADGSLARRSIADEARSYAGDDLTVIQRPNQAVLYAHVKVGGQRIASIFRSVSLPSQTVSQAGVLYYHRDRVGSVVATSSNGGVKVDEYRYSPYGALDRAQGNSDSELGYAGALRLSEGLLLMGERVYSPDLRRFLQPDDVDDSRYSYAGGDPINVVDPTGELGDEVAGTPSIFTALQNFFRIDFVSSNPETEAVAAEGGRRMVTANAVQEWLGRFSQTDVGRRIETVEKKWEPIGNYIDQHPYQVVGTGLGIAALPIDGWVAIPICAASGVTGELDDIDFKDVNFQQHGALLAAAVLTHGLSTELQLHHFLTNKNSQFTPIFAEIVERFGLKLDALFNKELLPHLGRHPIEYHQFVLKGVRRAALEAGNDTGKFLKLFETYVKEPIRANPSLLTKAGWGR